MPSVQDPVYGWVDNLYGPISVTLLTSLGLMHVMCGKKQNVVDFIPVDYVVNTIIASCWGAYKTKGIPEEDTYATFQNLVLNERKNKPKVPVFNVGTSYQNPVTWRKKIN